MLPLKRFMDGLPWRWWGSMSRRIGSLAHTGTDHFTTLLREGRWEGVVHRRGLTETNVVAAVRQIVRRDTTGGLLDIVEFSRNAGSLSQAAYLRMDAELQSSLAASWELDTSPARPLLDAIAEHRRSGFTVDFDQHPDWVDKMLTATRILAVNDRAVRIFGAHAGYEQMIGQPVGAFWPAESRAGAGRAARKRRERSLASRDTQNDLEWKPAQSRHQGMAFGGAEAPRHRVRDDQWRNE